MGKHKTPRPSISHSAPKASCVVSDQALPVGLYPEDDGSCWARLSPATFGLFSAFRNYYKYLQQKHRCPRKSGKGAGGRQRGKSRRQSPEEHQGLNKPHLGSISYLYSQISPRLQRGRDVLPAEICDLSKQVSSNSFSNSLGCLVENQLELPSTTRSKTLGFPVRLQLFFHLRWEGHLHTARLQTLPASNSLINRTTRD